MMLSGFLAFRVLPSIAKILAQFQLLRFYRPTLSNFLKLTSQLGTSSKVIKITSSENGNFKSENQVIPPLIRIVASNASYSYSKELPNVFQNASFELCAGQIIGLVGPSGVGKSTLLDCIIGLRELSSGSIFSLGVGCSTSAKMHVAYVPQAPIVFEATVWRNLLLDQIDPVDLPMINANITQALDISGFADVMKVRDLEMLSWISEGGRNLSGGQRQRLALARALLRQSNLLVLDEATGALDGASEDKIYDEIRKHGRNRIVIIVTHRLHLLKYCDQVIEIMQGGNVNVNGTSTH
jgi:ABC-type bacteriocin/lantibiotic exporter with double-glycine peptidase domain